MTARTPRSVFALLLFAVVLVAGVAEAARMDGVAGDFVAFRCAAQAMIHGADPYLQSPLYSCESSSNVPLVYHAANDVAIPAPLPGYALAVFTPFALLPLWIGVLLWIALSIVAVLASAWHLRALDVGFADALVVLVGITALVCIPYGEIVPLALFAVCACAYALQRERSGWAVGFAALASIEPHLGMPVMLALVAHRATRVRAVLAALLLLAMHAIVLRGDALTYFLNVLPEHARAELARSSQFSLSWILSSLGASSTTALAAGSLSYAAFVVGGVALAFALARRFRQNAFLALVPPAFALFGGTFVHVAQMLFALPLALVLVKSSSRSVRTAASIALVALAFPWMTFAQSPLLLVLAPLLSVALVRMTLALSWRRAAIAALGATLVAVVFAIVKTHAPSTPHVMPVLDPTLAEWGWGRWIALHDASVAPAWWLLKLPTWFGLVALAAAGVRAYQEHETGIAHHDAPMPVAPQ